MNDNYIYHPIVTDFDAEINRDLIKNINRKNIQLDYEQARELQRQKNQENRKKQIDMVTIQADGTLEIETKSLAIPASKRRLCNFKEPHIMKLFSRTDPVRVYDFSCKMNETITVNIYLDERKIGNCKYMLERFTAKGLEIYGTSRKVCEDYISKIWTVTLNRQQSECLIPDEFGWWRDASGKLEFVDKDRIIWQEVRTWV